MPKDSRWEEKIIYDQIIGRGFFCRWDEACSSSSQMLVHLTVLTTHFNIFSTSLRKKRHQQRFDLFLCSPLVCIWSVFMSTSLTIMSILSLFVHLFNNCFYVHLIWLSIHLIWLFVHLIFYSVHLVINLFNFRRCTPAKKKKDTKILLRPVSWIQPNSHFMEGLLPPIRYAHEQPSMVVHLSTF